jgi:hypothetical protein
VIYAIRAVGTEYIKFGVAIDVKERLRVLQTGCPFPLELVATCEGDQKTETWIHWRLFQARAHHMGEWFKDGEEAKRVIFEMLADDIKPEGAPSDLVHIETLKRRRLGSVLDFAKRKKGGWA